MTGPEAEERTKRMLSRRQVTLGFRDQTRYFPENVGMFIAQQALLCSPESTYQNFQLGSPPTTRTMIAFLLL
jgi:hypothetical protein